jgi:hypothetical protein
VPGLLTAFESVAEDPQKSANLAELLAEFAQDDVEAMGESVLFANASADAVLFPIFASFGSEAVRKMRDVLEEPWSGLGVAQADPEDLPQSLQDRFTSAGGVVKADFLFRPSLPLAELEDICRELRPYNFRPRRIRFAAEVAVAGKSTQRLLDVIWIRDSCNWILDTDCNAASLITVDGDASRDGLSLSDLLLIDGSADGGERFVAVWSESELGSGRCRCIAGVTAEDLAAQLEPLHDAEEFRTITSLSVGLDQGGVAQYSAILRERGPKSAWALNWNGVERFDWPQTDVSAVFDGEGKLQRAALWLQDPLKESLLAPAVSPVMISELIAPHLERGWRIASSAHAPAADAGKPRITLLLQRPAVVESQRQWEGSRRAAAVTALMRLNEARDLLPPVSTGIEPETEAALLYRIANYGVDAEVIETLLTQTSPPKASPLTVNQRRFLILAIGEFGAAGKANSLTAESIQKLLSDYADDPDPGIHGAAEWSLWQHGQQDAVRSIQSRLAKGVPEAGRRWYLQPAADASMSPISMAVLEGPHEFLMGSPLREWARSGGLDGIHERRHRRRIPRTFAIGMHEITVEQFRTFCQTYRRNSTAVDSDRLPATLVTWYEAAAFCNWLSEQAGIPRPVVL